LKREKHTLGQPAAAVVHGANSLYTSDYTAASLGASSALSHLADRLELVASSWVQVASDWQLLAFAEIVQQTTFHLAGSFALTDRLF